MTLVAEQKPIVTPEDLLRVPDNNTMELVGGRIVEKKCCVLSSEIEGTFLFRLHGFLLQHPGVANVFPVSLGYRCFPAEPDRVCKPSTTVVRLDRLRALPDSDPDYMPIVPDLAIEVVSPKDLSYAVEGKVQEYLDAGFPLIWVAHPKARTVTVHQPGQRPVVFAASDEIAADTLLPGFRCKVADFFPRPTPRTVA